MNAKLEDIFRDVRVAIDEIATNDSEFLSEQDESELDGIIRGKLCEAVDFVHLSADLDLMMGDGFVEKEIDEDDETLDVTGMLRFIMGKRAGWKRSVREVYLEGSEEWSIAMDEWVGASVDRPAVLEEFDYGKRIMRLLPETGDGKVVMLEKCVIKNDGEGDVVGDLPVLGNEYVVVDGLLYSAMVNYLSGLVLMVLNEDRGENMMKSAMSRIGMDIEKS